MEQRDAMIGENANTDRWLVGPARESRVVFLRTVLRMDLYSGNLYLLRLQVHKKCEKRVENEYPRAEWSRAGGPVVSGIGRVGVNFGWPSAYWYLTRVSGMHVCQ